MATTTPNSPPVRVAKGLTIFIPDPKSTTISLAFGSIELGSRTASSPMSPLYVPIHKRPGWQPPASGNDHDYLSSLGLHRYTREELFGMTSTPCYRDMRQEIQQTCPEILNGSKPGFPARCDNTTAGLTEEYGASKPPIWNPRQEHGDLSPTVATMQRRTPAFSRRGGRMANRVVRGRRHSYGGFNSWFGSAAGVAARGASGRRAVGDTTIALIRDAVTEDG
ncbi:hypothetical protein DFP72DRAFT_86772 [Ephemerocybe angulata]|uniref:Uncharacterized protein n=1 Tax=Ephemerocybe angulata TaxID=980116 RepID=A0A8H6LVF3_9AGAR|nr:hypothetical protein DFP72DRAFT_86772 [Tulosesus angulatus]